MPFENQLDINVRAFFFNAETDYLPYYKNFTFTVQKETTLKDVLQHIKAKNPNFSYPEEDLLFRVNDLVVTGEENVEEVVMELGEELLIEPALKYRSDNGLILNNHDFIHNFRHIFKRHNESKEDLAYYLTLYPQHYASETFNYNHEYIGDAILILAHKIIMDGSDCKDEILKAINDPFNGIRCCEYENNVYRGEDFAPKIAELKEMIRLKEKESLMEKLSSCMLRKLNHKLDTLENHSIAFYAGDRNSQEIQNNIESKIKNSSAKLVKFSMSHKLAGQTILHSHIELAHQKAGTVLLDALDSGADTLICAKESDLTFFKKVISKCERQVGREIELKLISIDEFESLK
jgi:hypothetical protein